MNIASNKVDYFRSDIQGLRGIAVLLVVIYHTGVALPGGYIGVDIFFVISGFVITQLMLREFFATGQINLANFFERRIRRILPAVAFAIIGTLTLSIFAMSPFGEQQQVAQTARASSLFAANFYFYLQNSYWALAENPLRHLWSLAVEEQFYIFFPVLLVILNRCKVRLNSRTLIAILLAIAGVSFLVSYLLSLGEPILPKPELFAFFGTPWRIWQFLAGAFVAFLPANKKSLTVAALPLSILALLAIIWSAVSFDSYTPFPGSAALIPVVSTAILIAYGQQANLLTKLLGSKALTSAGDISYSWYLWHWPLIVFAHRVFPASEVVAPVAAALISIAPAIFSLRRIENPIRHNPKIRGTRALRLGAFCVVTPLIFSVAVEKLGDTGLGLTELRSDPSIRTSWTDARNCQIEVAIEKNQTACESAKIANKRIKLMLVGDSGASAFSDAVSAIADKNDFNFASYYANGCPTSFLPMTYRPDCAQNFEILQKKISQFDPDILVIANMSDLYVDGSGLGAIIRNFEGEAAADRYEGLKFWIENWRLLLTKRLLNQKVLVIQQPPLSAMREPILLRKIISATWQPKSIERFFDEEVSRDNSDTRNMIVEAESELFKNYQNVSVFDPASVLCDGENCRQTMNGEPLYYDGRHLTVKGSLLMVDGITKALQPLLAGN